MLQILWESILWVCWGGVNPVCRVISEEAVGASWHSSKGMRYRQPWGAWQLLNRSVRLAHRGGFTASRTQSMSTLRQGSTKSTDVLTVHLPKRTTTMKFSFFFFSYLFYIHVVNIKNLSWAVQHKFHFKYWMMIFSTLLTHWCLSGACFCSVLRVCLKQRLFSLQLL